jgi:Ankyrin repeats (3 copies)
MIATIGERRGQLSCTSKRKRSDEHSNNATKALQCSSIPAEIVKDIAKDPADFLRQLLSLSPAGRSVLKRAKQKVQFEEPSADEVEGYDMVAVQAIRSGDVEKLRALHATEGRTMNSCNQFRESLFHLACRRGDVAVVRFMLHDARVRVTVRDDYGRSAVHDAFWTVKPNLDVLDELVRVVPLEMLLMEDVRGHTPFQYARAEFHPVWEQFLRDRSTLLLQMASKSVTDSKANDTVGETSPIVVVG